MPCIATCASSFRGIAKNPAPAERPIRKMSRRLITKDKDRTSILGRRVWARVWGGSSLTRSSVIRRGLTGGSRLVLGSLRRPRMLGVHNFSRMAQECSATFNADSLRRAREFVAIGSEVVDPSLNVGWGC